MSDIYAELQWPVSAGFHMNFKSEASSALFSSTLARVSTQLDKKDDISSRALPKAQMAFGAKTQEWKYIRSKILRKMDVFGAAEIFTKSDMHHAELNVNGKASASTIWGF